MTKAELREVITQKERIIAELNDKIDELEAMAISSQAVPMTADASRLISTLSNRIRDLEDRLNGV
jgi:hypothetical protein